MRALFAIVLAAGLSLAAGAARAHPHVWITATRELLYAPDGSITGVRHAWTFANLFSASRRRPRAPIPARSSGRWRRPMSSR